MPTLKDHGGLPPEPNEPVPYQGQAGFSEQHARSLERIVLRHINDPAFQTSAIKWPCPDKAKKPMAQKIDAAISFIINKSPQLFDTKVVMLLVRSKLRRIPGGLMLVEEGSGDFQNSTLHLPDIESGAEIVHMGGDVSTNSIPTGITPHPILHPIVPELEAWLAIPHDPTQPDPAFRRPDAEHPEPLILNALSLEAARRLVTTSGYIGRVETSRIAVIKTKLTT